MAVKTFFGQFPFHYILCSDPGMIGSGKPEDFMPAQTLPAAENVDITTGTV